MPAPARSRSRRHRRPPRRRQRTATRAGPGRNAIPIRYASTVPMPRTTAGLSRSPLKDRPLQRAHNALFDSPIVDCSIWSTAPLRIYAVSRKSMPASVSCGRRAGRSACTLFGNVTASSWLNASLLGSFEATGQLLQTEARAGLVVLRLQTRRQIVKHQRDFGSAGRRFECRKSSSFRQEGRIGGDAPNKASTMLRRASAPETLR